MLHFFKLAANACGTQTGFLPSLYDAPVKCVDGNVSITTASDIFALLGNVVRVLIAMSGALAVIFIIVGGIFYVISAGDPGRIKRAKDILTNAITGLLVIVMAYGVVTFIAKQF